MQDVLRTPSGFQVGQTGIPDRDGLGLDAIPEETISGNQSSYPFSAGTPHHGDKSDGHMGTFSLLAPYRLTFTGFCGALFGVRFT